MNIEAVQLVSLPKIPDDRGNLSFFQNRGHIPFDISRVYWIYDVPGGERRGGHAYHTLQEFIIALSGSFDVILHDGRREIKYTLNRSYYGLLIPNRIWRHMENFSTNAVALITADRPYSEVEYIRNFEQFKATD